MLSPVRVRIPLPFLTSAPVFSRSTPLKAMSPAPVVVKIEPEPRMFPVPLRVSKPASELMVVLPSSLMPPPRVLLPDTLRSAPAPPTPAPDNSKFSVAIVTSPETSSAAPERIRVLSRSRAAIPSALALATCNTPAVISVVPE